MTNMKDKNIRVPLSGEAGKHTCHKITPVSIDVEKGVKALYCSSCKKIITSIFAKNKGWTPESVQESIEKSGNKIAQIKEVLTDQSSEFIKLLVGYEDGTVAECAPTASSFILDKSFEDFAMGVTEDDSDDEMNILKLDKQKRIVYGVFLVPEKADHDGDVISEEDIEKVAHDFLVEYRTIDEMHKRIISADIVESMIAWDEGIKFQGKELKKGTWFGAIKIKDDEVWEKVQSGEYKAFSVRIAGAREPVE